MCYVSKDRGGRGETAEDNGGEKRRGKRAFLPGEMGDACPCIKFEVTGDMGRTFSRKGIIYLRYSTVQW